MTSLPSGKNFSALETKGWKLIDFNGKNGPELSKEEYDLSAVDSEKYRDALFCRERWIKVGKKGDELEQRLIVTFSFKYRDYLRYIREKQVARAKGIFRRTPGLI